MSPGVRGSIEAPVDPVALAAICRNFGVQELSVFGSVARGEDEAGSDIDLLYLLAPDARLGWRIEALDVELVELFDRPVDLVSKNYLHPLLRDSILSDAVILYAA